MTNKQSHTDENTHLLQQFEYIEPSSLGEAQELLAEYGSRARLIAGGTHLLAMMKINREAPEAIINIGRIPELREVRQNDQGSVVIGSAVTIHDLRNHPLINEQYTALAEACSAFGSTQIEIMGTIGGNICNASPASDTVPALLVFDARVILQNAVSERSLPLEEFLLGPGETAIQEGELLTAIELPTPIKGARSAFIKVSRVAADLAKASAAVMLVKDGSRIGRCHLAFGAVAPTALRTKKAEEVLAGKTLTEDLLREVGDLVTAAISPIGDIRSTSWYRRKISGVMAVDAINLAWDRAAKPVEEKGTETPIAYLHSAHKDTLRIPAGKRVDVELCINNKNYKLQVASNELLLNVLRDRLDLTGAKYGCGLGECGSCTVLVDGKAALSCLLLAASLEGRQITTVEGLQSPAGELNREQEAYIEEAAIQCGYCTPGFLMLTRSLLDEIRQPEEEHIREYFKGSRCRCTGYASIVRAVLKSVEKDSQVEVRDAASF